MLQKETTEFWAAGKFDALWRVTAITRRESIAGTVSGAAKKLTRS